jgi:hypothetical protein
MGQLQHPQYGSECQIEDHHAPTTNETMLARARKDHDKTITQSDEGERSFSMLLLS